MRTWVLLFAVSLALPLRADQPPAQEHAIVAHLNQAIAWYRRLSAQVRFAREPSDVMFIDQDRQLARQALAQAFDGARGLAGLAAAPAPSTTAQAPLSKRAADAAAAAQQAQANVESLQKQLAAAPDRQRQALEENLAEARSELSLFQVRAQTLKALSDFSAQVGTGATGLLGQIDELERSVPEVRAQAAPAQVPTSSRAERRGSEGVISLIEDVFQLARNEREIHQSIAQTTALRAAVDKLRAPVGANLRSTLQQADQLAAAPESNDAQVMSERRKQLDELTAQVKKLSAALLPLAKEGVLLDAVRAELSQWDTVNDGEYGTVLRSLAVRAALLLAVIGLLLSGSQLWRRATFRYLRDPRRRQVSLLVRRIVVTALVTIAVLVSLVNEIGSLATFAGFITAGIAVALQNVILSVAAYFFLIGKYGLRVGERVQIGNVIGDVLEIGLVRLHVMETGPDGLPTGRVVVFSNSVVFQGPNLFKPLPGTTFAWHEIKLTLAGTADHRLAEEKVLRAVEQVVEGYRTSIDRQHAEFQDEYPVPLQQAGSHSRLRLTETGLEMLVRYPVPLDAAAAVDDKVARAVLEAIESEPRLRLAGAAAATLQSGS